MSLAKLIAQRMVGAGKKSQPAPPPRFIRERNTEKKPNSIPAPPRALPEPDLAQVVRALPLPPPVHDVPPAVIRTGWVGSCKAICADTGRRCRLPAHPGQAHRHERGGFFRVAGEGQTSFPLREALDEAATSRRGVVSEELERKSGAQEQRESRARRVSAHRGDSTTTGIRSIDTTTPTHEAA